MGPATNRIMTEQELRALVRDAIERHLGRPVSELVESTPVAGCRHPSHLLLPVRPGGAVDDGMCLIEPAVRCSHCGYCQSYGH